MIARRNSNLLSYSLLLNLAVFAYLCAHALFGESRDHYQQRLCPIVPPNLSHRERVRQIEEQQLQRLVAAAALPSRSDVVLKHLNAEAAFNEVIEEERRGGDDDEEPQPDGVDDDVAVIATTDAPSPVAETTQQLMAQTPEIDEVNGPQSWEALEENATAQISATEQRIQLLIDCQDGDNRAETLQRGEHWVLKNFLRAEHGRLRCFETITYTTHADYTFLDNLQPLLERWQAPISIALFAPGTDLTPTLESIRYVRDCGPHSDLVRQYATFHLYFPNAHLPASLPSAHELVKTLYDCSLPPPYQNVSDAQLYKTTRNLLYPVNVGRNIARDAAMTHFLLASDIELYPNPGLPQQFLEMIARNEDPALRGTVPRLWPLALFEVEADAQVPVNKTVLQQMLTDGTAVTFHKRVCAVCHSIPRSDEWMAAKQTDNMSVFHVGKRVGKQYHWEPIYIGTHADPHYDERLSWEGKSDKMTQGYALCALDYEFQILNNAFLVHRPGIKVYHNDVKRSALTNKTNQLIRNVIFKELKVMYGWQKGCAL